MLCFSFFFQQIFIEFESNFRTLELSISIQIYSRGSATRWHISNVRIIFFTWSYQRNGSVNLLPESKSFIDDFMANSSSILRLVLAYQTKVD